MEFGRLASWALLMLISDRAQELLGMLLSAFFGSDAPSLPAVKRC
jgi:hypothetical protein